MIDLERLMMRETIHQISNQKVKDLLCRFLVLQAEELLLQDSGQKMHFKVLILQSDFLLQDDNSVKRNSLRPLSWIILYINTDYSQDTQLHYLI